MLFSPQWFREDYRELSQFTQEALVTALRSMGISVKPGNGSAGIYEAEPPVDRSDLLCLSGLAREAAAALLTPVSPAESSFQEQELGSIFEHLDVDVPAESCLRFSARMAVNCQVAKSPEWLQKRLLACGIAPRNNLCDIAAWIRLETGIPLRILDAREFSQISPVIRDSFQGEQVPDGKGGILTLEEGLPVVCDENYMALYPAGIPENQISQNCHEVFLFCGIYNAEKMERLTKHQTASSDSLRAHCRALDPMASIPVLDRACSLIESVCGGRILDGTLDNLNYIPQPRSFPLPPALSENIKTMLSILGFSFSGSEVILPSYRMDLSSPEDLSREIFRLQRTIGEKTGFY